MCVKVVDATHHIDFTWQSDDRPSTTVNALRVLGHLKLGDSIMIIRPVAVEVPTTARMLRGEERVQDLSLRARDAAAMCAVQSGLPVPDFLKDDSERPLPTRGVHWSVAHKPKMVVGVAASEPIAVDVEAIRPRSDYQIENVFTPEELEILGGDAGNAFFCGWVAKEAVLKLRGVGLSRLSRTKIVNAWSDGAEVSYEDEIIIVSYAFFSGHVAAITAPASEVDWTFFPADRTRDLTPPRAFPAHQLSNSDIVVTVDPSLY